MCVYVYVNISFFGLGIKITNLTKFKDYLDQHERGMRGITICMK